MMMMMMDVFSEKTNPPCTCEEFLHMYLPWSLQLLNALRRVATRGCLPWFSDSSGFEILQSYPDLPTHNFFVRHKRSAAFDRPSPNSGGPLHTAEAALKPTSILEATTDKHTHTHTNFHLFSTEEGWTALYQPWQGFPSSIYVAIHLPSFEILSNRPQGPTVPVVVE